MTNQASRKSVQESGAAPFSLCVVGLARLALGARGVTRQAGDTVVMYGCCL
jgi:hypothetical protein